MKSAGTFEATFTTKGWAQYASDKLTGFEYPPGCRVIVKFIPDAAGGNGAGPAPGEPDVNAPFYPVDVPLPAIKPTVSKLGKVFRKIKEIYRPMGWIGTFEVCRDSGLEPGDTLCPLSRSTPSDCTLVLFNRVSRLLAACRVCHRSRALINRI